MPDKHNLRLRMNHNGIYLEDPSHGTAIDLTDSINLPWTTIEPNGRTTTSVTVKLELELDSVVLKPTGY